MDSQRTQIVSIELTEKSKPSVYQLVNTFQKDSLWPHYSDIKGLKEF